MRKSIFLMAMTFIFLLSNYSSSLAISSQKVSAIVNYGGYTGLSEDENIYSFIVDGEIESFETLIFETESNGVTVTFLAVLLKQKFNQETLNSNKEIFCDAMNKVLPSWLYCSYNMSTIYLFSKWNGELEEYSTKSVCKTINNMVEYCEAIEAGVKKALELSEKSTAQGFGFAQGSDNPFKDIEKVSKKYDVKMPDIKPREK